MARVILVYGSTTGNTEKLAEDIGKVLKQSGAVVVLKNVTDADAKEISDFDAVVLGCSTWGDGELQDDFINFYRELKNISLQGKKAAVFGTGDSEMYPDTFCKAVDMIEERVKECGAEILIESLKVDGEIAPAEETAEKWGRKIAELL